jgi:hypothetical protein
MEIDLVFFDGCPHVVTARQRLTSVLASMGSAVRWREWDTAASSTPDHLRAYSSPTILVNGVDVERKPPTIGAGCAVGGGPSVEMLRTAIASVGR